MENWTSRGSGWVHTHSASPLGRVDGLRRRPSCSAAPPSRSFRGVGNRSSAPLLRAPPHSPRRSGLQRPGGLPSSKTGSSSRPARPWRRSAVPVLSAPSPSTLKSASCTRGWPAWEPSRAVSRPPWRFLASCSSPGCPGHPVGHGWSLGDSRWTSAFGSEEAFGMRRSASAGRPFGVVGEHLGPSLFLLFSRPVCRVGGISGTMRRRNASHGRH